MNIYRLEYINYILNVILSEIFSFRMKKEVFLIKCHLSRIMGEKKLKVAEVARAIDVHRNAITLLYDETATRVELETINKLCVYLDCKVEDLFEFCPG